MHPRARTLTRRGWSLAGAAAGLIVAGRLLGTVELAVLATGVAILLAIGALWTRTRRFTLVARRVVRPARLHVGGDGRVDLVVTNQADRSTPMLAITDVFDDGRRAARFVLPPLPPDCTARAAYRIPTSRRGRYQIGPLTVAVTDPFGVARRSWTLASPSEVLVCPRIHDILAPRQAGGRVVASVETVQARAQAADGEEFLTLREYQVGDDLRRVHWRSSARLGELMIRQDEAQWRARSVVVLDTRPEAHRGSSFEIAVEATASIVDRLTRMRRRIDVSTSDGAPLTSPRSRDSWAVMDRLATIEPDGSDRFAAVLASHGTHRTAALVVAVAGSLTAADASTLAALTFHGTVILVATRPGNYAQLGRSGIVVVDASSTSFRIAWNQALTECHLAPPPQSSPSRSPR
jgi:uncharacterized protein (DUF58 family)